MNFRKVCRKLWEKYENVNKTKIGQVKENLIVIIYFHEMSVKTKKY